MKKPILLIILHSIVYRNVLILVALLLGGIFQLKHVLLFVMIILGVIIQLEDRFVCHCVLSILFLYGLMMDLEIYQLCCVLLFVLILILVKITAELVFKTVQMPQQVTTKHLPMMALDVAC